MDIHALSATFQEKTCLESLSQTSEDSSSQGLTERFGRDSSTTVGMYDPGTTDRVPAGMSNEALRRWDTNIGKPRKPSHVGVEVGP